MNSKKLICILTFSLLINVFPIKLSYGNNATDFLYGETVKTSSATVEKQVIPGGKCVGITLSIDGVMIAGTSKIICTDGTESSPAESAGLKPGDIIKSINGIPVESVDELQNEISQNAAQNVEICFLRKGQEFKTVLKPNVSRNDNSLKIGAWVKDAVSGIGTLTYFDPVTGKFAALGHGICCQETNEILDIDEGQLMNSTVIDISKGKKGVPGELKGIFSEYDSCLGTIESNSNFGINGMLTETDILKNEAVTIGSKNDIKIGPAHIYTNVEGDSVEKYEIKITNIIPDSDSTSKNMVIIITDQRLLNKTGGIVQGMSGSPIVQNGKLVGAVTHVFVNDPTRGYGIFIENMLAEAEKIK